MEFVNEYPLPPDYYKIYDGSDVTQPPIITDIIDIASEYKSKLNFPFKDENLDLNNNNETTVDEIKMSLKRLLKEVINFAACPEFDNNIPRSEKLYNYSKEINRLLNIFRVSQGREILCDELKDQINRLLIVEKDFNE